MKHSNIAPEIDDDSPHRGPPERALWCAVLETYHEDIQLALAELKKPLNILQRAIIISFLDSVIAELISATTEDICEMANVPHGDFVDGLLRLVRGVS